jgi:hypothetical protein
MELPSTGTGSPASTTQGWTTSILLTIASLLAMVGFQFQVRRKTNR